MAKLDFRSPLRKLLTFFQTSRDRWKEKCQQAKYELKLLKRRFSNLKRNCDQWRARYEEVEAQRRDLQCQVKALSQERAELS